MAGMLPGVECARRRRLHQAGTADPPTGSRRSSFCLYTSGSECHLTTTSSMQRINPHYSPQSCGLGHKAREARERLDERLRTQRALEIRRRHNSTGSLRPPGVATRGGGGGGSVPGAALAHLQREVFGEKKAAVSRKLGWGKKWKGSAEQDECAVCLEVYRTGDALVNLPCAHRFHWSCAVPWVESSSRCPCCRTEVSG